MTVQELIAVLMTKKPTATVELVCKHDEQQRECKVVRRLIDVSSGIETIELGEGDD